ncbi:MAG: serine hydrolase, partial [Pseudomonadota bacterium]
MPGAFILSQEQKTGRLTMAQKRMTSGRLRAIGGEAWSLLFVVFTGPAIAGVEEAAKLSEQSGGVAMVVMRGGAVAFEDYADGAGADTAVQLASGTKSFAGVIAAAAVKDGLLALDERVAETLTEWDGDLEKETITIRQLLALTSGVDTPAPGDIPTYSEAIARPMKTAPGAAFAYGPVNFQIFGEVIRRKLLRHGD